MCKHIQSIKLAANIKNIRGMYDGLKKAVVPVQSKTATLKSFTGVILTKQATE